MERFQLYLLLGAAAFITSLVKKQLANSTEQPGPSSPEPSGNPAVDRNFTLSENEALGAIRYVKLQRPTLSDIPDSVVMATIAVESNFDPNALGTVGEIGLMQIRVPLTWNDVISRAKLPADLNPYDVGDNILVGMSYLRLVRNEFAQAGLITGNQATDWTLIDQGYNLGPAGVKAGKRNDPRAAKFIIARDKYLRAGLA